MSDGRREDRRWAGFETYGAAGAPGGPFRERSASPWVGSGLTACAHTGAGVGPRRFKQFRVVRRGMTWAREVSQRGKGEQEAGTPRRQPGPPYLVREILRHMLGTGGFRRMFFARDRQTGQREIRHRLQRRHQQRAQAADQTVAPQRRTSVGIWLHPTHWDLRLH